MVLRVGAPIGLEGPQEHVHHHLVLDRERSDGHADLAGEVFDYDGIDAVLEQPIPLIGKDTEDP